MKKSGKIPLLDLLCQLYPEVPREKLFSRTLCGEVVVDGEVCRDPKMRVSSESEAALSDKKFVSRGGWKLEGALAAWEWPVAGLVLVDAGSSTGGFTDALLQRGARLVHAVDVGFNQLDWRLRQDERVRCLEETNIMTLDALDPRPAAAVADLSFRSLRQAARHILSLTTEGRMIALVKPQFEWLNPDAQFNGIVPGEKITEILEKLMTDLAEEGVGCRQMIPSPVRGRKGNQEYLAWLELANP